MWRTHKTEPLKRWVWPTESRASDALQRATVLRSGAPFQRASNLHPSNVGEA